MAVKRKYRLNLRNYGNLPAIMLSQYDEGYALEFEIRDGTDAASDLSAYTVTLKGTRADTLAYSFAGTVSTNVLTFVIDTTMTACAGRGTAEIAIKDTANDVLFATFNMPVFVERAAVPEGSIDADVERAQEIAEEVEELIDGATEGAEAWAVGQRGGVDVESTDETYHNNAKYYAEQAADSAASIGIDATLTQAGKAADAKKTGDEINALKEDLSELQNGGYIADAQQIQEKVNNYLDEHPEATTTVQDGSLTEAKFSQTLAIKSIKDYVTPEMFGAVGDGVTDDTNAFISAVASGKPINGLGKTYKVGLFVVTDTIISDCNFVADSKPSHTPLISVAQGKSITLKNCSFTSTNDQSYADYVDGANTSNLYFIYAGSGAKVIDIDGCIFKNGLMDILVQGSITISTDKIIVKNCTSVGSCMFVDFGYCSDVTIENCIATQNENVNAQSHLIYLGNGDANKAIIKDCTFHEYKGIAIHGYHGSNYDVTMIGCTLIVDDEAAAVLLSGDGCTLVVDNCSIEAEYPIRCSTGNNIDYLCKNSNIKARGQLVAPSDDSSKPIIFKDCIIECRNINQSPSVYVGNEITLTDADNVLMTILGTVLINNYIKINNTNQHPIRPRGNCKIIGNTVINESVTTYVWYASGDNNIIKNNVMINFPNKKAGNVETTDNIIIEPVATT